MPQIPKSHPGNTHLNLSRMRRNNVAPSDAVGSKFSGIAQL